MDRLRRCAFAAVIAMVVSLWAALGGDAVAQEPGTPTHIVEIRTSDDRLIRFRVEVADQPDTRARGLMFRDSMALDAGMLFVFDDARQQSFWMRNTLITLDIIYFDAQGRLVNVQALAQPLDETGLPSAGPAQYVLEINGGWAALLGIGPGATLRSDALEDRGLGLVR